MHIPHFWLELFAEMEKPGKGASGLEDKTRSNLLSAKCCETGLGQDEPRAGAQFRADPIFQVRGSEEGDLQRWGQRGNQHPC